MVSLGTYVSNLPSYLTLIPIFLAIATVHATLHTTLSGTSRMLKDSNFCTPSKISFKISSFIEGPVEHESIKDIPFFSKDTIKDVSVLLGNLRNILEEWVSTAAEGSLSRGTRCLYNEALVESSY